MKSTQHLRNCVRYIKLREKIFFSLYFFFFIFQHDSMHAQSFCSFSGIDIANDEAKSIVQTFDGGFAVAGKSDSAFVKRALLFKYDSQGNLIWTKILSSTYSCEAYALVQTKDSTLLLIGQITTPSSANGIEIFIAKVKLDGTLLFQKTIGNTGAASDETAFAATTCPDGGILMVCQSNKNLNSAIDLMLVKVSASGNLLWVKDLIDPGYAEVPVSIKCDAHHNFLLAGYLIPAFSSNPMFYDMFLVKLDSTGNVKWSKTIGGNQMDLANDLVILSNDAGYAICGRTESFIPATAASSAYLAVMDTTGTIKWSRTFNLTGFELIEYFGLTTDASNNILACGLIQNYNNNDVSLLVKYNATNGNVVFDKVYENYSNSYSSFRSLIKTSHGYAVCGKTNRYNFSDNIQLMQVDLSGNSCCSSDTLLAFTIDSGFASVNWNLNDTMCITLASAPASALDQQIGPGTYNYCLMTAINELDTENKIAVFPNPSDGIYELEWSEINSQNIQVEVYSVTGNKILSVDYSRNEHSTSIDLTKQPKGIYLLKINCKGNNSLHQKLVKN